MPERQCNITSDRDDETTPDYPDSRQTPERLRNITSDRNLWNKYTWQPWQQNKRLKGYVISWVTGFTNNCTWILWQLRILVSITRVSPVKYFPPLSGHSHKPVPGHYHDRQLWTTTSDSTPCQLFPIIDTSSGGGIRNSPHPSPSQYTTKIKMILT